MSSTTSSSSQIKTGELKIPTSFGYIAAKTWGEDSADRLKVLAVHGWQDNAGTFDRLFPLLPLDSMYIVAIDLPGHGSSSHLPKGIPYTDLTWVIEIKRVLDNLQWTSGVTIIAHSMGANASLEVATLYPEVVNRLVMIDTVKQRIVASEDMASEVAKSILLFNSSQKLTFRNTRVGDIDKAINAVIQTHLNGSLTKDAALCLLHRAIDFNPLGANSGIVFKRDQRLNYLVYRKFDKRQLLAYLSGIQCKLLLIRARQTHHTLRCPHESDFLEMYREKCPEFIYSEVDGDHYVHLTKPTQISEQINAFLEPAISELKSN